MQTKIWPFSKEKSKGYPVYVESPTVINNVIKIHLEEDRIKYRKRITI